MRLLRGRITTAAITARRLRQADFYYRYTIHQRTSFSSISPVSLSSQYSGGDTDVSLRLLTLIEAFRNRGHYAARLDPLTSTSADTDNSFHGRKASWLPKDSRDHPDVVCLLRQKDRLDLKAFDLETVDVDKQFYLGKAIKANDLKENWSINELVSVLKSCYSDSVGIESSHIENNAQRLWLIEKVEGEYGLRNWSLSSPEEKIKNFKHLIRVDHTALFLNKKFPSSKVFGIEGCESLINALWSIAETAVGLGVKGIEMGMAHRGRMNVLHNFLQKRLSLICNRFNENELSDLGDVKYHLGTRAELSVVDRHQRLHTLHLSLAANPSHLEAVNAVVLGKTKAKQFFVNDSTMREVMPILLHGDASFSGQGIVPEVMELSDLPDYTVGGCIHVVINNQIGFTTDPSSARSSYHCTNAAKGVGAPIFHVNGDDVDAVASVCQLAVEWRQMFNRDVVIDIVCYRRHGHNSLDDPSITQPHTNRLIENHPTALHLYREHLILENILTREGCDVMSKRLWEEYEMEFQLSRHYQPDPLEWFSSNWQGKALGSLLTGRPYNQTGVAMSTLQHVGACLTRVPGDLVVHKDVKKLLGGRARALTTGDGITMGFAESLAFGCLMTRVTTDSTGISNNASHKTFAEAFGKNNSLGLDLKLQEHPSVHVRLSGQDVIRGTFNQRHAAIYCQESDKVYWQLNNLADEQASISVCNSALSEAAVLGFEYGYSLENEMALTIWEAQFGDFANNAQAIIDNFIASGESKWNNYSSLVMLLPHGYDGQGPEHSSARLERFLQLVDDDPDVIPGVNDFSRQEILDGFRMLGDSTKNGGVTKEAFTKALIRYAPHLSSERIDIALAEIITDLTDIGSGVITQEAWFKFMNSWLQRNSERKYNMFVVAPTTPSQYFHCLRRQIHRPFSKPLVVMSSKWLLHHKPCSSRLEDMSTGTFFHRVIAEGGRGDNMRIRDPLAAECSTTLAVGHDASAGTGTADGERIDEGMGQSGENIRFYQLLPQEEIKKVIFCSGKIFYHLYHARTAAGIRDVTIVRVEQIAPFPYDLLGQIILKYPNANLVWVQEEPKNMGAWGYVKPRFDTCLRESHMLPKREPISFIGRKPAASPATGAYKVHVTEQKMIVEQALGLI